MGGSGQPPLKLKYQSFSFYIIIFTIFILWIIKRLKVLTMTEPFESNLFNLM